MEYTLVPPGEYGLRRRCGLMSNYFEHMLLLLLDDPLRLRSIALTCSASLPARDDVFRLDAHTYPALANCA